MPLPGAFSRSSVRPPPSVFSPAFGVGDCCEGSAGFFNFMLHLILYKEQDDKGGFT